MLEIMQTEERKKRKLGVVVVLLLTILMTGCKEKDTEYLVSMYGKEKSYYEILGVPAKLSSNEVYYDITGLTGDYKKAAEVAIEQVDNASSYLNFEIADDLEVTYVFFQTSFQNSDERFGYNKISYSLSTKRINGSKIYLNTEVDGADNEDLIHFALHEIGHTLGLDDLYSEDLHNNSVMYYGYDVKRSIPLIEFTEFDIRNIQWKYGE